MENLVREFKKKNRCGIKKIKELISNSFLGEHRNLKGGRGIERQGHRENKNGN